MCYEWDELKRQSNIAKHGVDFSDAPAFVWAMALIEVDFRQDYGETRWIAFGPIGQRLHVMVYSKRAETIRLISLRKANQREFDYYASQTDTPK
ncbi:BrnT family toxin [Eoetvoesia caeni]|nr:BrnT family toxin [Eoetvoesiella caeni]